MYYKVQAFEAFNAARPILDSLDCMPLLLKKVYHAFSICSPLPLTVGEPHCSEMVNNEFVSGGLLLLYEHATFFHHLESITSINCDKSCAKVMFLDFLFLIWMPVTCIILLHSPLIFSLIWCCIVIFQFKLNYVTIVVQTIYSFLKIIGFN